MLKRLMSIFLVVTLCTACFTGCVFSTMETGSIESEYLYLDDIELEALDNTAFTRDTDGDGYVDLVELEMGTDIEKPDVFTVENGVKRECNIEDKCILTLEGTPNIARVNVSEYNTGIIKNKDLLLSSIYDIFIDEDFSSNIFKANLSIKFNTKGLSEEEKENVAIYQYLEDGTLVKVNNSKVEGDVVTATLEHFSRYTVSFGDVLEREGYNEVAVYLCLDDSGSMYTYVNEEKGLIFTKEKDCSNDEDGKRWVFAKEFMDSIQSNESDIQINVALCTFTGERHINHKTNFGEIDGYYKAIEEMQTQDLDELANNNYFDGTAFEVVLAEAVDILKKQKASTKYVIVLTDGKDTTWRKNKGLDAIKKQSNITPIMIGLGENIDEEYMRKIASYNHGLYVHLSNSSAFNILNSILQPVINSKDIVAFNANCIKCNATDANAFTDEVEVIADSGFRAEIDGFPFRNFSYLNNNGVCFGLSETAQRLYYDKSLTSQKYNCTKIPDIENYLGYFEASGIDSEALRGVPAELLEFTVEDRQKVYDFFNFKESLLKDWEKYLTNGVYEYNEQEHLLKFNLDKLDAAYPNFTDFVTFEMTEIANGRQIDSKIVGKPFQYFTKMEEPIIDMNKVNALMLDENRDIEVRKVAAFIDYVILLLNSQGSMPFIGAKSHPFVRCLFDDKVYSDKLADVVAKMSFSEIYTVYSFFEELAVQLRSGEPSTIGFAFDGGGHVVTCQRLLRSLKDPTVYYLEVYDCNGPGMTLYIMLDLGYFSIYGEDVYCLEGSKANSIYQNVNNLTLYKDNPDFDISDFKTK